MLSTVSFPEYIVFIIHSLEYKTLVVEQLSEERERTALQHIRKEPCSSQSIPYGVLLYTCVIRDLTGVGFEHVGAKGQEIIQAVVGIAAANYPGEQSTLQ